MRTALASADIHHGVLIPRARTSSPLLWTCLTPLALAALACGAPGAETAVAPLGSSQPEALAERAYVAWPWTRPDLPSAPRIPYDFTTTLSESIKRPDRTTAIKYAASGRIGLDVRSALNTPPAGPRVIDVRFWPISLNLDATAGRTTYQINFTTDSLLDSRTGTPPRAATPADRVGSSAQTFGELLNIPGVIPMSGKAWKSSAQPPELYHALAADWLADALYLCFPPLPSRDVALSESWKSGLPVPLSAVALPSVQRVEYTLANIDPDSAQCDISFFAEIPASRIRSRAAISHIGPDAVATGKIDGRLLIDQKSGLLVLARINVSGSVVHERLSPVTTEFSLQFELTAAKPQDLTSVDDDSGPPDHADPFAPIGH